MDFKKEIQALSKEFYNEILSIRRHIHKNPELSFKEFETSKYICSKLDEYDIKYQTGFGGTGILGVIEGAGEGKTIALRADMDALPIEEAEGREFGSCNKGVMHACGHDAHSASLLGTAKILKQLSKQWKGRVLLIFQPGEESFPGGASLMLKDGVFNEYQPDLIIGQHVLPDMPTGEVGFKEGMYMASGDEVHLTIRGKGGHAAMPHTLCDTVLTASQIVVSMQQIVSRFVPANIPTVLSFGKFVANGATNIIPQEVVLAGTLRTMNEEWRAKIKDKIRLIATNTAQSMGAECEVKINDGYPVVFNNEDVTKMAHQSASEYLGSDKVNNMDIRMTAEDFGYYTQLYPCTFYRFGVKQSKGNTGSLHTPDFNLNEDALDCSMGTMAYIAIKALEK